MYPGFIEKVTFDTINQGTIPAVLDQIKLSGAINEELAKEIKLYIIENNPEIKSVNDLDKYKGSTLYNINTALKDFYKNIKIEPGKRIKTTLIFYVSPDSLKEFNNVMGGAGIAAGIGNPDDVNADDAVGFIFNNKFSTAFNLEFNWIQHNAGITPEKR